mgnify:CR=1 FL=1
MIYILLSTYNGSKYLGEFLESLSSQNITDWVLMARDDGSSDDTKSILTAFAVANPRKVEIVPDNENLGASGSFGKLLSIAVGKNVERCQVFTFN